MDIIPNYKISIVPEEGSETETGMFATAFTSNPAIEVKGMAFNKQSPMYFKDELKMRIAAPVMIPDIKIYRKDEDGEYTVEFSKQVIEDIHSKFMQNMKDTSYFNLEHNSEEKVPAYLLECWIVENPKQDKAFSSYGVEVPKGTLFAVAQVTDQEYYNSLVENDQVGFSIEAFLGLELSKFKNNIMSENKEVISKEEVKELVFDSTDMPSSVVEAIQKVVDDKLKEFANESEEEVVEEVKEEELAEEPKEEEVVEEELMEPKEEEVVEEEVKMMGEEEILAVVNPLFDAFKQEVLEIIADLQSKITEEEAPEEEAAPVEMSRADRLTELKKTIK